jgi:polyhydroxyalkanoate synthesis regulator phasin
MRQPLRAGPRPSLNGEHTSPEHGSVGHMTEADMDEDKAIPAPAAPRRGPGHRGADMRDTVAEMAERAQLISQEAGSKVSYAMKDVISAAAGLAGFAIESARDLVNYMVRRGQMTQEEGDKLIREAEEAHGKKPASEKGRPTASKIAADKAAADRAARDAANAAAMLAGAAQRPGAFSLRPAAPRPPAPPEAPAPPSAAPAKPSVAVKPPVVAKAPPAKAAPVNAVAPAKPALAKAPAKAAPTKKAMPAKAKAPAKPAPKVVAKPAPKVVAKPAPKGKSAPSKAPAKGAKPPAKKKR